MEGTRLSGLWKNKGKDGKTYLSGSLGSARLLVMPNDYKKAERDPDYIVYVVPAEKKAEAAQKSLEDEDL